MEGRFCWFVAWLLLTVNPIDATNDWLPPEEFLLPMVTTPKPVNSSEEGSGSEEVTVSLLESIPLNNTLNETESLSVSKLPIVPTLKPSRLPTTSEASKPTARAGSTTSKRKKVNRNRQRLTTAKTEVNITEAAAGQLNDNPWFYGSNDALYGRGPRRRNQSKETKVKNPVVRAPVTIWDTSPNWKESEDQWGIFWPVHYYATGSLFVALSLYSVISLLRVRTFSSLISWGRFLVLHVLLLLLGVTRGIYLLYDPYASENKLHPLLACVLFHVGDPCLVSSFAVVMSALLNETLVPFAFSGPIRRPTGLAALTVFHFSIACGVIAGTALRSVLIALVGHFLTSLWSVLLTATFVTAFPRLRRTALRRQGDMIRVAFTKLHIDGAQLPRKLPRPTLALSVRLTLLSAFLCLTLALLRLYGIVSFFWSFHLPEPWTWWGCQLATRLTELLLATSLAFVASQPIDDRFFDDDSRGDQHTDSTLPLPDTLPLRSLLLQQHPTGSTLTSEGRPSSMLFKDNGFIRFRTEDDPEQPLDCSEDDDEEEGDSVKANAGSLCDAADVVMSPFFHRGKRFSRGSLDTSASSEQLSRNGLSNSAIDFQLRKYGSTCSSESAANSFDVTFFLQQQRSISPMAAGRGMSATPRRRIPGVLLNLNLRNDDRAVGCGVVNVACGTEDITPDSAVYLDLHLAKREIPLHSHSLGDLVSSSRSRRTLLKRFKGSSFSLNASLNGYEPLDAEEDDRGCEPLRRGRRRRWGHPSLMDVRDFVKGVELPQVDSGLLGDCVEPVLQVDRASQTDHVQAGIMSVCDEIGRWNSVDVEVV